MAFNCKLGGVNARRELLRHNEKGCLQGGESYMRLASRGSGGGKKQVDLPFRPV